MRTFWLAAAVAFVLHAGRAAAQPVAGAEATAFVRVIGDFRAEYKRIWKLPIERRDIEIATGSGFVISPAGLVLTNHHVISGRSDVRTVDGEPAEVTMEVTRIEAVVGAGASRRALQAAVVASDPDLDLVLLSVTAGDLPYLPFGDSDAVDAGQAAQVLGFPYGRRVEVGRPQAPGVVPSVTVSAGSVSALRGDAQGDARYLQTDAAVHPGSSGGPMLDADGYAIGVVRSKLAEGGAGFAIPINLVKDFLEANGFLAQLPARRLRLGPPQSFDWKGVRLSVPDGLDDASASRLRLLAGAAGEQGLLSVDRVATSFTLARLEEALVGGELDGIRLSPRPTPQPERARGRVRFGSGLAMRDGTQLRVEYALFDLGPEKLVVRFAASPDQIAFNLSVIRATLESVEPERLMTTPLAKAPSGEMQPARLRDPRAPTVSVPGAFVTDETPDGTCPGLGAPDSVVSASPAGDFTVAFRVSFWSGADRPLPRDARTCPSAIDFTRLGDAYRAVAALVPAADGLLRFEAEAPREKWPLVDALAQAWLQGARALAP